MIQFDKDGVTLFYLDANGNKVSHNYMEGAAYDDMVIIRTAQMQAARDNTQAQANYATELATAQINYGRPGFVLPVKPMQKVVADADGAVSYTPFVPALGDLVVPHTDPSTVGGLINSQLPPTVDKQAVMFNMVQAMFRQMFPNAG